MNKKQQIAKIFEILTIIAASIALAATSIPTKKEDK